MNNKSQLIHGDCVEVMQGLEDKSVDVIITDPPYFMIDSNGNGFMGKNWDSIREDNIVEILSRSKQYVQSMEIEVFEVRNISLSETSPQGILLDGDDVWMMLIESISINLLSQLNVDENYFDKYYFIPFFYLQKRIQKSSVAGSLLDIKLKVNDKLYELNKRISSTFTERINTLVNTQIPKEMLSKNQSSDILSYISFDSTSENRQHILQWLLSLVFFFDKQPSSKMNLIHFLISQFHTNWMTEALRVLKPGSFCFAMNAPRSDCVKDMINAYGEAGFDISFTPIYFTFLSGFPKAMNMSKSIDRKKGLKRKRIGSYEHPQRQNRSKPSPGSPFSGIERREKERQLSQRKIIPKQDKFVQEVINFFFDQIQDHKDLSLSDEYKHSFKRELLYEYKLDSIMEKIQTFLHQNKLHELFSEIEDYRYELEKLDFDDHQNTENTRQNPYHSGKNMRNVPTGKEVGESIYSQVNLPDKRVKKKGKKMLPLTEPACEESKAAQGSYAGFNPKPAVEVIIVAMKPMEHDTYTDQYLSNGKAVSWFDDCRYPYPEFQEAVRANSKGYATQTDSGVYGWNNGKGKHTSEFWQTDEGKKLKKRLVGGRLDHGYSIADEKLKGYKHQDIKEVEPNLKGRFPANLVVSDNALDTPEKDISKYFSLDYWYEDHLPHLPQSQQQIFPFLYVPKPTKAEKNKGLEEFQEKQATDGNIRSNPETARKYNANYSPSKNNHPTVKPVKLMQYLIILSSRPDDIILDPFSGSGTTCVAAKLEDRKFIGIELNEEYYQIMKARVAAVKKQKKLDAFFTRGKK